MSLERLGRKIDSKDAVISVVGLGYVGTCLAAVLADSGYKVVGVDVNPKVIEQIRQGKAPFHEPGLEAMLSSVVKEGKLETEGDTVKAVGRSDVIFVTVGTPIKEGGIDLTYLRNACKAIGEGLGEGKLIVIKSTVPPGTTESVVKPILEAASGLKVGKDFALAHSPERLAEGKALRELRTLPEVVGGTDDISSELAAKVARGLGVNVVKVSSPRVAEMVKMADNVWIDQSIALANQLALICEKLGVDVHEVIKAANTLPKGFSFVNIMLPGLVGGSCLTKDPYFLANLAKEVGVNADLILAGRKLNEGMYLHVVDLVRDALAEAGKQMDGAKVAVLGLAFKGDTSDLRASQALLICKRLQELGARVEAFDPYVKEEPSGIRLTDMEAAVKGADCVVVATEHSQFKKVALSWLASLVNKPAALVDARAIFDPKEAKALGFVWRGLGRPNYA
jgi:UDP-N-acetyl-D-mannosaminuronic acid dehydrogenase